MSHVGRGKKSTRKLSRNIYVLFEWPLTDPFSLFSPPHATKPERKGTIASPGPILFAKVNLDSGDRTNPMKLSKLVTLT